jgi:lambda repressor-like predicted transcriptional regulator
MDAFEINYRLRRVGKTQVALARDLGVSNGVVSNVIHGRVSCYSIALHIAQLLDESVELLWPGRYEFKPRNARRSPATDPACSTQKSNGEPSMT